MGSVSFPVFLFMAIGILGLLVGGTCLLKARRRIDPENQLHSSDKVLVWCGISSPLIATGLYLLLGSPDYQDQPFLIRDDSVLVQQQKVMPSRMQSPLGALGLENAEDLTTQEIISKIKENLPNVEGTPQETMGWMMLGRTYAKLNDYDNAVDAYQNALEKVENPEMKIKIQIEYLTLLKASDPKELTGMGQLILQDLKSHEDASPEIKDFLSNFMINK